MTKKIDLSGLYVIFKQPTGEEGHNQGIIEGRIEDDIDGSLWLIQLFSWFDGRDTKKISLSTARLSQLDCAFFSDHEEFVVEGKRLCSIRCEP